MSKKKHRPPRRRNASAAALAKPCFRPRVVAAKKGRRPYVRSRLKRLLDDDSGAYG